MRTFPMTAMRELHTSHQGWLTGGVSLSRELCSQERSLGIWAEIFPFQRIIEWFGLEGTL